MSVRRSSVRDLGLWGRLMQSRKMSSSGLRLGSQKASGALR